MTAAAHPRYGHRLVALADDAAILPPIAEAAVRRSWWSPDRAWVRTYARFEPDREPFATLVFEAAREPQQLFRVEAFATTCPPEASDQPSFVLAEQPGWLRVTRFPFDPGLPTLPAVLALPGRWTAVRYLPSRRCTLRFEHRGRTQYVKVYPNDRGRRAYGAGRALWRAAGRGELDFAVPRPVRWCPTTRALWQAQVRGSPAAATLYGPAGARMAARIGRAAASLARSRVRPRRVFDAAAQMAQSVEEGREVARRVPGLARAVQVLLGRLADLHARVGSHPLRPIHGDPHADQWLDDGSRLALVDFEAVALGDPELDAAIFLAELDFEDQLRLPVERLEEAFLAGYAEVAGPLDRRLLVAYRAHKRLSKALRSARAVRPDGDLRADAHLGRAIQGLGEELK